MIFKTTLKPQEAPKAKADVPKLALRLVAEPLFYLLPFAVGILVFTLYPILNVFLISFKENYSMLTGDFRQYGLDNYRFILNDRYFVNGLRNTAATSIADANGTSARA